MRFFYFLGLFPLLLGCAPAGGFSHGGQALAADGQPDARMDLVAGKTQPAPGHVGIIAPAVLHPVTEVLVQVGDHVNKGQALVKLDSDEPEADVRGKQAAVKEMRASLARLQAEPRQQELQEAEAALESNQVTARAARAFYDRIDPLWKTGSISEQRYHEAQTGLRRAEADERGAAARLEKLRKRPCEHEVAELEARVSTAEEAVKSAEAELEHYTIEAPLDGVVTALDVHLGTVSRPGTTVWGEILDLSVIDVRCDLSPRQADKLTVGQPAEVTQEGRPDVRWPGKVMLVNPAADAHSGRVPVLVRVPNPQPLLRCYVDVRVGFLEDKATGK
jgi:multidrug resistance efflux pump